MKAVLNVMRRELAGYFSTPVAWVFIVIFLVMALLFRSLKVGAVSMIPNLIPIAVAAGVMGWAGFNLTVSTAMIASVAIGIAVDDTIHYFARFLRDAKRLGDEERAARHRDLHATYKPDDNARDRAVAAAILIPPMPLTTQAMC